MAPETPSEGAKVSKQAFDELSNRISLALAKREALIKSWTASSSRAQEPRKTEAELDAEDALLFRSREPAHLGVGAPIPAHFLVSEAEQKSLRAKFFPPKRLQASKVRDAEEKASSAKRGLKHDSSDEEEGRSGLGRAKKLKTNVKVPSTQQVERANGSGERVKMMGDIEMGGTNAKVEAEIASVQEAKKANNSPMKVKAQGSLMLVDSEGRSKLGKAQKKYKTVMAPMQQIPRASEDIVLVEYPKLESSYQFGKCDNSEGRDEAAEDRKQRKALKKAKKLEKEQKKAGLTSLHQVEKANVTEKQVEAEEDPIIVDSEPKKVKSKATKSSKQDQVGKRDDEEHNLPAHMDANSDSGSLKAEDKERFQSPTIVNLATADDLPPVDPADRRRIKKKAYKKRLKERKRAEKEAAEAEEAVALASKAKP